QLSLSAGKESLCRKHPGSLIVQRSSTAPVWNNLLTFSLLYKQPAHSAIPSTLVNECRVSGTNLRTAGFLHFFSSSSTRVAHLVGQVHSEPGRILDARVQIPPAAAVLLFRTKRSKNLKKMQKNKIFCYFFFNPDLFSYTTCLAYSS
ncbi:hypothetical protein NQZ68_002684, partial [Dissostichus eleginoides]